VRGIRRVVEKMMSMMGRGEEEERGEELGAMAEVLMLTAPRFFIHHPYPDSLSPKWKHRGQSEISNTD